MADNDSGMGRVITVDNFSTEMAALDSSKPLHGLVDMGSNGIRFSISDLSLPASRLLTCIYRERVGISLYDALHESGPDARPFYFSPTTIAKVAQTLARFKSICDGYGVPGGNISVFATEATRTAKNKDDMLSAIRDASGLTVDILSPAMESLFGAMGARSGYDQVDGLFMDLGGGSVQMTYVNSLVDPGYDVLAAKAAKSMPFGAAKLTAALSETDSAHATKEELRGLMKGAFEELTARFPQLKAQAEHHDGITIYFCGGGFRGYGSMLMHTDSIQPYPIPAIGGYVVPGNRFAKWREMLHANNYDDGKIYGLSKRRRQQFPAIVTVVQALVEAVPKIKQVVFCSGGNHEGVLFMKLSPECREQHPLSFLPSKITIEESDGVDAVARFILSSMPSGYPAVFSRHIIKYIASNTWQDMGDPDSANSAKALHDPISGTLAGLPGMTHQARSVLALTMCHRWGSNLGPGDAKLAENLQALVAVVMPCRPASQVVLQKHVSIEANTSHGLGKKGHKVGIRMLIKLHPDVKGDLRSFDIEKSFEKIGKGLKVDWKVEAEVEFVS
ncbi:putative Retrograde regulation protein 2 [Glarea lozoyensis 74030]|uniref:Putative Retrograde regulation protein 2 n=1 Tax=Glarea lozoyensis (strain ATCC 74030 / MF5533) TaxID=1104152 RepID=H0EF41_GLAL7|nr:putative Retrograde regulation protein 2 [Glarea lozoyensis 74030]